MSEKILTADAWLKKNYPVDHRSATTVHKAFMSQFADYVLSASQKGEGVGIDWNKLENEFYDEHTEKRDDIPRICTMPHAIFDFFYSRLSSAGKGDGNKFLQGCACALTAIIKSHGCDTPVIESWRANFGKNQTVESLKELGIDEYDIEVIGPYLNEINR